MFKAEVRFPLQSDIDPDAAFDLIEGFFGAWTQRGQILDGEIPMALVDDAVLASVTVPEEDSLDDSCASPFVRNTLEGLETILSGPLETRIVGPHPARATACDCDACEHLILFTNFGSNAPPLRCGGCFGVIPLYRLSGEDEPLLYDLRMWQNVYRACDQLDLDSGFGERFGITHTESAHSGLSERGLMACEETEELTGIPTFLYLKKGSGSDIESERERRCPGCDGAWMLDEPWHDLFDFRCDPCRLVSNVAFNVRASE